LERLLELIVLLQSVVEFFMERQIVFKGEYNVIRRNGAVALGAVLLLNDADILFRRLLELVKTPLAGITRGSGTLLVEMPLAALLKNLKEVIAKQSAVVGKEVTSATLRNIAVGQNKATIATIIITCLSKAEGQCSFLLEYN
jgi:hypothetical protein